MSSRKKMVTIYREELDKDYMQFEKSLLTFYSQLQERGLLEDCDCLTFSNKDDVPVMVVNLMVIEEHLRNL